MAWLNKRPEAIVVGAEPTNLLAELRTRREMESTFWPTLDYVLRVWTLRALTRRGDLEGLLELDSLSAAGLRALPQAATAETFRIRWSAFRDLIEAKRLSLGTATSGRAHRLSHTATILRTLADGPLPQSVLREELQLSPARLSQVLAVLEQAGLVDRSKKGRENIVSLPSGDSTVDQGVRQLRGMHFARAIWLQEPSAA